MAKISANYEVVFIIDPAQGEEGVAALTEKFKTLVEQNSSAMEVEEWGKRKLAYAINYITEGYYVLISFTSAPEFPKELDRILRITDLPRHLDRDADVAFEALFEFVDRGREDLRRRLIFLADGRLLA